MTVTGGPIRASETRESSELSEGPGQHAMRVPRRDRKCRCKAMGIARREDFENTEGLDTLSLSAHYAIYYMLLSFSGKLAHA